MTERQVFDRTGKETIKNILCSLCQNYPDGFLLGSGLKINSAKIKLERTIYGLEIITLRGIEIIMESLILAKNERWRRV